MKLLLFGKVDDKNYLEHPIEETSSKERRGHPACSVNTKTREAKKGIRSDCRKIISTLK